MQSGRVALVFLCGKVFFLCVCVCDCICVCVCFLVLLCPAADRGKVMDVSPLLCFHILELQQSDALLFSNI